MGTPALINFKGHDGYNSPNSLHLYKPMDGDPVTVLRDLASVVASGSRMVTLYREANHPIADRVKLLPATLEGLYTGETTGPNGKAVAPVTEQGAGNSYGEWRYVIDTDAKTVTVLDEDEKPCDPYTCIERLHEEYQTSHTVALVAAIGSLAGFGYTVTPDES